MNQSMNKKPNVAVSMFAGAAAGASETMITYPMEYLKTRRQLPSTDGFGATMPRKSPSSLQLFRETIKRSGLRGLYSGCSALTLSNAAKGSVRFISFSQSQALLKRTKVGTANPGLSNALAGLIAGATESILVVTPGEALKTKMIHYRSTEVSQQSLARMVARTVESEGVRGLWKGLNPVLCKQATNSAVRFATFGWLQTRIAEMWPAAGMGGTLMAGAASGVVTTYASMPFDNIKTRMQAPDSRVAGGMARMAILMLRHEGVLVFWRATTPRLMRLTMSSAVTFTVFNEIVALSDRLTDQRVREQELRIIA